MKDYISASINSQFLPGPLAQLARSYYHNRESNESLISCQGAYAKHRIFKSYYYLLRSKERYRYYNLLKMIYFFNFFGNFIVALYSALWLVKHYKHYINFFCKEGFVNGCFHFHVRFHL